MFRHNPEFMSNPYVGGFDAGGKKVYFVLSERGKPLFYNDTPAAFASKEDAMRAYSQFIYRGKKDRAQARIQVVEFGNVSNYSNIERNVANTLNSPGLNLLSVDQFGAVHQAHMSSRGANSTLRRDGNPRKAKSTSGLNDWRVTRFVAWNLRPGQGGLGAAAQRAYANASQRDRIGAAIQAAGISVDQLLRAQSAYLSRAKGLPAAEKQNLLVQSAAAAGFSYIPKPPGPGRGGRGRAASSGTGIPMPGSSAGGTTLRMVGPSGVPVVRVNPLHDDFGDDFSDAEDFGDFDFGDDGVDFDVLD